MKTINYKISLIVKANAIFKKKQLNIPWYENIGHTSGGEEFGNKFSGG